MLEINKIRNHIKYYSEALKKRGIDKTNDQLNTVILLDDQRKSLKSQLDKILTESNSISKEIGVNIQSGNATKIENLKKRSSELKENSKKVSEALKESESKIKNILIDTPNVPDNKVPDGNSDKNNIIISSSDIKLKTNVQRISDPLDKIIRIEGVSFNWKKDNSPSIGVIANELEKVLPQLVTDSDPKAVNYNGLIGVLIEAVKEQQSEIDSLKERISKLE